MSGSPAENFRLLVERISLSRAEKAEALDRARAACEVLRKCPPVRECMVVGSIARSTAIREYSDVDIVAVLGDGTGIGENSDLVISEIAGFLSSAYSGVAVFESAVRVEFSTGPGVDVVPALSAGWQISGHPVFEIPAGAQSWTEYAPGELEQRVTDLVKILGDEYKQVIRLVKWWSRSNGYAIASYEIEAIAGQLFSGEDGMPPLPEAFAAFLLEAARIAPEGAADRKKSLIRKAALIAESANALERCGDIPGAVERWRCLLGEQFPADVF